MKLDDLSLKPTGFFAFRTPLLPFEDFQAWSGEVDSSAVIRELLGSREIQEALFVASPHLIDSLGTSHANPARPESKKSRRSRQALVRYLTRMATRPTPFGLFAGCSVGTLGEKTRLHLDGRGAYKRHTRLDSDYLFALCEDLERDPNVRAQQRYFPNTTLHTAANRLRYAEAHLDGRNRIYHLISVDRNDYLDATLQRARDGATLAELAEGLVNDDPDGQITREDAQDYLHQLIDTQILVSPSRPMVTGREAIHPMIEQYEALAPEAATHLSRARDALDALDVNGLGAPPGSYRAIAEDLEALPTRVELPRLFQVDMIKPCRATLGPEVLEELKRGVAWLHRMAGRPGDGPLKAFRDAFRRRYEDAEVPLVEALDEELGVGFGGQGLGNDASPLLAPLQFPSEPREVQQTWTPWHEELLRKLEALDSDGDGHGDGDGDGDTEQPIPEIEISSSDLETLDADGLPHLPAGLQVLASLAAPSEASLDRGDFQLLLRSVGGPSGASLFGRFCHADDELAGWVHEHLRAEEALDPDAIFAEIVHLPEGRLGNIIARPRLRDYEIPFLGRGAAPKTHQIPVTDLRLSLQGDRFILRSERLGRRVVPRLTCAHNFSTGRNLATYRFLCHLQTDGFRGGIGWIWGPLGYRAFLPRVRSGRLVFSRARWRVQGAEIKHLDNAVGDVRDQEVARWKAQRGLPDRVVWADGDNELLVDLRCPASVDAFLAVARRRPELNLVEFFPGEEQLCVQGPEGAFTHELIVPFTLEAPPPQAPRPRASAAVSTAVTRKFPPGSEWLYLKLYTGRATADQILRETIAPLLPSLRGMFDHWFFIRYGDPDWHLRLRFHGEPRLLHGDLLPVLSEAAEELLAQGLLHRVQVDTYNREIERYGGPEGIELAERVAHVDSEAVLSIVELLEGSEGAEARWQMALRGSDLLLKDLGFDLETRLNIARRMQWTFAHEHHFDTRMRKSLGDRLRQDRGTLDTLLAPTWDDEHPFSPGFEILAARSERLAPLVSELRRREEAGRLTASLAELAPSLIHMFNNRLLRSQARAHEAVLYDFLHQRLRSETFRKG